MRFNSEAYEKAFPRETHAAKVPETVKPGNVLEEADKIVKPEETPEPETPEPEAPETSDPGGGVENGD